MRKICAVPVIALVMGLAGITLRRAMLATGFDPATGLAIPGTSSASILAAVSVAVLAAALLVMLLAAAAYETPKQFRKAFYTKSYLSFAATALLGVFLLICALILAITGTDIEDLTGYARWIFVALTALGGVGIVILAYYAYTQKQGPFLKIGSIMPSMLFCYWLVAQYRINAGNPVLTEYCYTASALAAASLNFYYTSGIAYSRKKQNGVILTGIMGPFLLTVALADPIPVILKLIILAADLVVTQNSVRFIAALRRKEPKKTA